MSQASASIVPEVNVSCNADLEKYFFLDRVSDELIAQICSTDFITLDFGTTCITAWAKPVTMSNDKRIGAYLSPVTAWHTPAANSIFVSIPTSCLCSRPFMVSTPNGGDK